MAKSSLDLVAYAQNLATSLSDYPVENRLVKASQDISEWVIRERIDKYIFGKCIEIAASKAYPNDRGSKLQKDVEEGEERILSQVEPTLQIVTSGCVGRLLGRDIRTQWVITTVATLFKMRNEDFAANVISQMMLAKDHNQQERTRPYDHLVVPIKAVVAKLIHSVYLNVTNCGYTLPGLPDCLSRLVDGLLQAKDLATILMYIQRFKEDCVVRSDHLLTDVVLWLYYHFDGVLDITVKKTVVLNKILGPNQRRVSIIVKQEHLKAGSKATHQKHVEPGQVQLSISNGATPFMDATSFRCESIHYNDIKPYERQPFYHPQRLTRNELTPQHGLWVSSNIKIALLQESDVLEAMVVASRVLGAVLGLRVTPVTESKILLFDVHFPGTKPDTDEKTFTLKQLFKNHPRLLQAPQSAPNNSGRTPVLPSSHREPKSGSAHTPSATTWRFKRSYDFIISKFRCIQDFIGTLRKRCRCEYCEDMTDDLECKIGCLQHAGMEHVLLLLAHGFADAMGAGDVAGNCDNEDLMVSVIKLFEQLLEDRCFEWDRLFEVVVGVTLGIPRSKMRGDEMEEYGSWCAAQSGSLLAVASWLSLSHEPDAGKLFSLDVKEGRIRQVPDERGMLRCETMHVNDSDRDRQPSPDDALAEEILSDWSACEQIDAVDFEVVAPVFPAAGGTYRLMTSVRSGTTLKMVDPGLVQMGNLVHLRPTCDHHVETGKLKFHRNVEISDFDTAIAKWSSLSPTATIEVSKTLTSQVKLNTLLSQSLDGCVIRDVDRCCAQCALDALAGYKHKTCWRVLNVRRPNRKRARTPSPQASSRLLA